MGDWTNFPNGLTSMGIPQLGGGVNNFNGFNGNVWFVDGDRSSNGSGKTPDKAFSTIGAAITKAAAYDTIYVKPKVPATDASDPEVYAE